MKKIKFRGISTETGKYVYGDLVRRKGLRIDGAYVFVQTRLLV